MLLTRFLKSHLELIHYYHAQFCYSKRTMINYLFHIKMAWNIRHISTQQIQFCCLVRIYISIPSFSYIIICYQEQLYLLSTTKFLLNVEAMSESTNIVHREKAGTNDGDLRLVRFHLHDWAILFGLLILDRVLAKIHPFDHFVGEFALYNIRYLHKGNTVPFRVVPVSCILPYIKFYYLSSCTAIQIRHFN